MAGLLSIEQAAPSSDKLRMQPADLICNLGFQVKQLRGGLPPDSHCHVEHAAFACSGSAAAGCKGSGCSLLCCLA